MVILALALLVAGCNAPADPGSPTRLTPAPLLETGPVEVAPGVTEAGVADPTALQDAHINRLANEGFTLRRVRTERYGNGTLRAQTTLVARFPGDGRYYVARTFAGPAHNRIGTAERVLQYGDANGTVRLVRAPNGTVLSRSVRRAPSGAVPRTGLLAAPFAGRTVTLVARGAAFGPPTPLDSRSAYRLRADAVADRAAVRSLLSPTLMDSLGNLTATLVVTEQGLIARLTIAYTVERDGEIIRVSRKVRYINVGTTTLDRPRWAVNATRQATGVRSTTVPS